MKILLVSHFFPPEHNAGAEKRTLGYALELRKLGHEVHVVCAGKWDSGIAHWNGYTDEVFQDIPVRRVNLNWMAAADPNRSLYENPVVQSHFEEWLGEWKPDIVHIISLITLSLSVISAVQKAGLPILFTLTDFWLICPKISLVRGSGALCDGRTTGWDCLECMLWDSKVRRSLNSVLPARAAASTLQWISKQPSANRLRGLRGMALDMDDRKQRVVEKVQAVDRFTAPSTFLGSVMENCGVLGKSVQIIHSGHDLSSLVLAPKKERTGSLRFGFIGQMIPVKGLHLLISAFQAAAASLPAQLLIYGGAETNPDYARTLQEETRGNSAIQWMGSFPHSQLGEVLSGLDVLVVPSQWHENNPRVIQEAFASHTPVIASNVGGIAEFVQHEINGLLFEHTSETDLEGQIRRILTEPELLLRLEAGIRPVKTNAEEMSELVAIYQELIKARSVQA
jgi:glycosyltransferase involved in cell wall biosynthesis